MLEFRYSFEFDKPVARYLMLPDAIILDLIRQGSWDNMSVLPAVYIILQILFNCSGIIFFSLLSNTTIVITLQWYYNGNTTAVVLQW